MRVRCEVEEVDMEGEYGGEMPGVCVRCTRCGHEADVYGTSDRSVRRGLVMLRDECPNGESNFYVAEEAEED